MIAACRRTGVRSSGVGRPGRRSQAATRATGVRVLLLLAAIAACAHCATGAEVPGSATPGRLRTSIQELLRRREGGLALRLCESNPRIISKSAELGLLDATARACAAIEILGGVCNARTRLELVRLLQAEVTGHQDDFDATDAAVLQRAMPAIEREYTDQIRSVPRAVSLLDQAEKACREGDRVPIRRSALYLWINAFRLAAVHEQQATSGFVDRVSTRAGLAPYRRDPEAELKLVRDALSAEKSVRTVVEDWATAAPQDPMPYLALAEWYWFLYSDAIRMQSTIARSMVPKLRPSGAWLSTDLRSTAREEWRKAALIRKIDWRTASMSDVLPLLMAAEQRDGDGKTTPYSLYCWALVGAPEQAARLRRRLEKQRDVSGTLSADDALLALVDRRDYVTFIRVIDQARALTLHRPLLMSIPPDLRPSLIWSSATWIHTRSAVGRLGELEGGMRQVSRSQTDPESRRRMRYLGATLGEFMRRSDLPDDWAGGTRLLGDSLYSLIQSDNLPPDQATILKQRLMKVEAEGGSASLPIFTASYYNQELSIETLAATSHRRLGNPHVTASPIATLVTPRPRTR